MHFQQHRGFTLIEVMVSLFIIGTGLLSLAGLQTAALKNTLDQAGKSQLDWLMVELVERIRANPGADKSLLQGTLHADNCPSAPTPNCSDNSQRGAATNCSANSAGQYHRWEVICGNREGDIVSSATEAVTLNSITLSCAERCSELSITLDWTPAATASPLLDKTARKKRSGQKTTLTVRL
jgi:type IV pilus assembly protein PilV